MQIDYQRHASLLRLIKIFPDADFIAEAKEDGYMISLDDFDKTFKKAYARLMRMKNQISIFQKEQEKEEPSDKTIDGLIVKLEKFQGYQFNKKEMSVKEFAYIYKNYRDAEVH